MAATNRIRKVAIVGAAGNVGTFITAALLETGHHTITALTRVGSSSTSSVPSSVSIVEIDYSKPETLVSALRDQDALIITLSGQAAEGTEAKLIEAAGEAGVPWIVPSDFAPDLANEELVRDVFVFQHRVAKHKAITELGKSSYVSIVTGFWYEYSLAMPAAFGFDFAQRTVTFFDDGESRVSLSTWPQIGRAVAALLSLPVKSEEDEGEGEGESKTRNACLEDFRDKMVYMNSFTVSQKDMLDSVLRVTGTKEDEWTISKESARERYSTGLEEIKEGTRIGFAKMLFTRLFFDDGSGDFESSKGTQNDVLGLQREDLDEATARAVERSKAPQWTG